MAVQLEVNKSYYSHIIVIINKATNQIKSHCNLIPFEIKSYEKHLANQSALFIGRWFETKTQLFLIDILEENSASQAEYFS